MAHGDAREGKWRGNWRMEWVASTLTRPRNAVYPALLTLMRTPRRPAVDWTDSPADLNGLVRLGERGIVVSACVPSGSARVLLHTPPPPFTKITRRWVLFEIVCLSSDTLHIVSVAVNTNIAGSFWLMSSYPRSCETACNSVWFVGCLVRYFLFHVKSARQYCQYYNNAYQQRQV